MNLHDVYLAAQIVSGNIEEKYAEKSSLPVVISQSDFNNLNISTYPAGTVFAIYEDGASSVQTMNLDGNSQ